LDWCVSLENLDISPRLGDNICSGLIKQALGIFNLPKAMVSLKASWMWGSLTDIGRTYGEVCEYPKCLLGIYALEALVKQSSIPNLSSFLPGETAKGSCCKVESMVRNTGVGMDSTRITSSSIRRVDIAILYKMLS